MVLGLSCRIAATCWTVSRVSRSGIGAGQGSDAMRAFLGHLVACDASCLQPRCDRRRWGADGTRDLTNRESARPQASEFLEVHQSEWSPDPFALGPRARHAGADALDQDGALELGKHGRKREKRFPQW